MPIIWVALSLLGAATGPFGTLHNYSLETRLVYWPLLISASILIGTAVRVFVESVLMLRHFAAQAPMQALLIVLLLTPPLYAGTLWFSHRSDGAPPNVREMALLIFATSIAISAIRYAVGSGQTASAEPAPPPPPPAPEPRIFLRLPEDKRAPLLRLSVRDHYVDVFTEAGETSLLLRLSDAILETEGVEGARVHRSHWVAAAAVAGSVSTTGKFALVLTDGTRVPVSRTYRAAAESMLAARAMGGDLVS
ncbi:LytTR family DNA-binding domain-containing protein [Phaeovulum sp.]|uniref:LytTR family DNA-binding domain-containing protein n=1 Tax=Phaeovulum sp. TaxID=2934796 RepID=UPI003565A6AC